MGRATGRRTAISARHLHYSTCSRRQGAHRVSALLSSAPARSLNTEEGVTLPLNYAELMGLQDVQLPLQPAVEAAYDELMNTPLEQGYSELARLGKEKLLFAARDSLHGVRGRTTLLRPSVQVEPLLLPGAMALLHQLRRYELVIQLSEEGAALGAREMRSSSRDTIKHFEADMALATALAQCGLADRALKAGQPSVACARLEEALKLLLDAPAGQRQLVPRLQGDIRAALAEYQPDAVADYLQVPLDEAQFELRAREVGVLRAWVAAPAAALRRDQRPVLTPDYMARVVPKLTSGELCGLYDWEGLAAGSNPARCPWYFPGLLKRAALAHLVAGFAERRPLLVDISRRLFHTIRRSNGDDPDAALSLAMCELLLGDAAAALKLLEEDERLQQHAQAQQRKQHRGKGAAAAAAPPAYGAPAGGRAGKHPGPEARHAVMAFVRQHSPEGALDLRPGLVAFGVWWLEAVAYPEFQDTALGTTHRPDLAGYFEDLRVQAYLAAQDGKPSGGLLGMLANAQATLLGRFSRMADEQAEPASSSARGRAGLPEPPLMPGGDNALPWLAGAAAVAAVVLAAALGLRRSGSGQWRLWEQLPPPPPEAAEAAAAIGLPAHALRPHYSSEQPPAARRAQQQRREQQASMKAAAAVQEQQRLVPVISKSAATRLVQQWLGIKAEAMGPRHTVERLPEVLAEPMLSAVAQEAGEAADSGWFWRIRPLRCQVDSVDGSALCGDGSGHATALATVTESADLWASNGKQADSYHSTYQVEYSLVQSGGAWRIASALVLGK